MLQVQALRITMNHGFVELKDPVSILKAFRASTISSVPCAQEDQPFHTRFTLEQYLGATTSNFGFGKTNHVENPISYDDYVAKYM